MSQKFNYSKVFSREDCFKADFVCLSAAENILYGNREICPVAKQAYQ